MQLKKFQLPFSGLASLRFKRFHASFFLGCFCVGVLAGLLIGRTVPFVFPLVLGLVVFSVGAVLAWKQPKILACVVFIVAGLFLGMSRGSQFAAQLRAYDECMQKNVRVEALITDDPTKGSDGAWRTTLGHVRIFGKAYVGELYAALRTSEELKRGDTVKVEGVVTAGFGSYAAKIASKKVTSVTRPTDVLRDVRESFARGVRKVLPEPVSSLGIGFVVGQKSALPDKFEEELKIVGLTHIVVASGYNLTILVRFARRLFVKHSKYLALVFSLALALGFSVFSGFSPSMVRAAIVTVLSLLAWYYGRRFHPILLIAYVAAASAAWYPMYVWAHLGWLLSFAAFTGVLVVAPIVTQRLFGKSEAPAFAQLLIETLSAEVMTLPLTMLVFSYIPVTALAANLLVGPVIPFAMLMTFIAGIVGMLGFAVVSWLALPAGIVVAYVVAVTHALSHFEFAKLDVVVGALPVIVWYVALAATCFGIYIKHKMSLQTSSIVE